MKSRQFVQDNRKKEIKEITDEITKAERKLQELRSNIALGKQKNFREIRQIRKEIARLKTILGEKALALVNESEEK